ncbi:USP16_45 [Mytilus coruscus]|uniref:USP16_45 n=1 Tax=Mytilus coruscus TaxID=42192 RepID=A0A6J8A9Y7_MYTCO|nr:USP16_45 [Mytilus coruscus]
MALIQAGLSEFNNENLNGFRSRTWRILSGNGFEGDFDGMFPHACLSHVMSSFYVLEHFKSNFDFGMYCFSVVLNSTDLTEASAMLKAVYYALLSKVLDKKTLFYLEQIQSLVAKLPKDITCLHVSEDLEVYQENHTTQQLFTEMLNPNQLTEEDFQNRSTNNEFSTWSEKILQDVKVEIKETIFVEVPGNNQHSKTLADKLHKLFIPTIALWSNMLLGDLSRQGNTNPYLLAKKKWMVQRANAKIEKRFQVLKVIALDGTTVSRLDELSAKLKEHITTVQDVAVLKIAKKGRKLTERVGRSKQTIQENWDKKPPKDQVHQTLAKKTTSSDKSEQEHQNKQRNTSEDVQNQGKGSTCLKSLTRSGDRDIALEDKEFNFMKSRLRGLQNIGNTCWFNACLVTFATTDIMQLALDKFCDDFSFCPRMTDVLRLMEKMHRYEADIFDYDVETGVISCQQNYGMLPLQQNDAEEYFGAVLHDLNDAL